MLFDHNAKALLCSTPASFNHFYNLFMLGQGQDKNYNSWQFSTLEKGMIPKEAIEDASYIKLREISLAYQMTNKYTDYLGLKSMSLRLSARDLITWTKYSGWDPETNMYQNRISGEDYFNQPQTWGTNFTLYFNW